MLLKTLEVLSLNLKDDIIAHQNELRLLFSRTKQSVAAEQLLSLEDRLCSLQIPSAVKSEGNWIAIR